LTWEAIHPYPLEDLRPGERWLLKSPVHLWALDVLIETFPDACIVLSHREPLECVASYCSMIAFLMRDRAAFDASTLGPAVLEYLARSLERALAVRESADPRRFVDVDYRDLLADPVAEVERIYAGFGLALDGRAREAMLRHLRENPKDKHGAHAYRLEDYGLTPGRVRERLAAYLERFGLDRG
jgi:Sulfotransferase family